MVDENEQITLSPALVVEDNVAARRRINRVLTELTGDACIEGAGSITEARARLETEDFAFAFVDIGLPDGNGIELIEWLRAYRPDVVNVIISAWGDADTVLAALGAGAVGYLLKECDDIELRQALTSVSQGGAPIDPFVARRILHLLPTASTPEVSDILTDRESEVLQLVARGYTNRDIAKAIELSEFTVAGYIKNIYRKLAVDSRTSAVFEARSLGVLR